MRTVGQHQDRSYMANPPRFNGWWRLWFMLTAVWLVIVVAVAYSTWPSEQQATHHPAFIYQLELKQRELLASEAATSIGVAVEMPNGYRLQFKPAVEESAYTAVARSYQRITVQAQEEARRHSVIQFVLIGLLPPVVLALLGIGVAWVRQGFKAGGDAQ